MTPLDLLLNYITLLQKMRRVYRFDQEPLPDRGHYDTSVEHSYCVTMLAWYIMEKDNLPLDRDKVIRYLLAHDVVETYAGDTHVWNEEELVTKHEREHQAQIQLQAEFPEFTKLHATIEQYEARETREANFAYAVDNLIDPICIYLDNGRTWKALDNTPQQVFDVKDSKIALSPEVYPYWQELFKRILEEQGRLFNQ